MKIQNNSSHGNLPKPKTTIKKVVSKPSLKLNCNEINDYSNQQENIPIPPSHRHTRSYGRIPPISRRCDNKNKEKQYSPAITPSNALLESHDKLSRYEHKEIVHFKKLYYLGCGRKDEKSFSDNNGYYKVIIGDHLAYRYEILEKLGEGSFGTVVKCKDHKTGDSVAIKIIRKSIKIAKYGQREVDVLDLLENNSNEASSCIVEKLKDFTFRDHLCIVFELLTINLYDFIKNNYFQPISLSLARRIITQVLIALKHTHSLDIIHCDIKPENIVFKAENKSGIKLIDFGCTYSRNYQPLTYIQSRFYRAPEVILEAGYDEKIDIWSLGCVLVEIITGWPLFPGENEYETLKLMVNILGYPSESIFKNAKRIDKLRSDKVKDTIYSSFQGDIESILEGHDMKMIDFVKRCLCWDKNLRISAETALLHPWIRGSRYE